MGSVGVTEQLVGAHHQLHLDRRAFAHGAAGEPLHEHVGHHLRPGAPVDRTRRLLGRGVLLQRSERRSALGSGQERHDLAHPVRLRLEPHRSIPGSLPRPLRRTLRVDGQRRPSRRVRRGADAEVG